MPFIAPFWGKKGLPIPIAAIVLWILLIYFSILRPANIEESNYNKTICKVYDFDYTVDCPFCQLAGFYCGVIFPSSTSDPISPIISYWSGDLKLVVKLYPEKYPDLGKSPPVQIPWQKWGKHAYKTESSKRLQPTINDRVECYVENDYKYTDSSDMYQPKILTEIKKSGSGYKTGLAFIIILPVIWAIIFLAMMRHLY
ncbi:hypothetical protein M0812_07822 [Anaeramoeba flamelloides]|uniref:Uncharacterized protein n=1 Tax=Anaeramoeba flamelloides TaxID=1746091 RepID=A0AAV8A386_9EUKA|nr:hypothetical protein M0812_07822 [Anaeramoeba flamelloides]